MRGTATARCCAPQSSVTAGSPAKRRSRKRLPAPELTSFSSSVAPVPVDQDKSAAALVAAGTLDIHGVAMVPGETAGFGRTATGVPVQLLPGTPSACLWSYELFAGRAIRRLGGRDPALPYRARPMTTARKIVSSIGVTEICPVRMCSDARDRAGGRFCRERTDGRRRRRRLCHRSRGERGVSTWSIGDGISL